MENYSVLLNSIVLIVVGVISGILMIVMIMNGKINKLHEKVDQITDQLIHINLNCSEGFYKNEKETNTSNNKVKIMSFRSEMDSQIAPTRETDLIQPKVKTKQTIGIVFCRNCASQFTSDKDTCPTCGAKRH